MGRAFLGRLIVLLSLPLAACTVHDTEVPAVAGPSEYAQSLSVTAAPDNIIQDGFSQSAILVVARDANNQALANLQLLLNVSVGGTSVGFGSISPTRVFTGSDGTARAVYTSPIASPFLAGSPGKVVSIVATPVGGNYGAGASQVARVLVTPPAALAAAPGAPTASLTYTPVAPKVAETISFDASSSQAIAGRTLVTYVWDFGDGQANDEHGSDSSHAYSSAGSYLMVLGVVDDAGRVGSAIRTIVVTN